MASKKTPIKDLTSELQSLVAALKKGPGTARVLAKRMKCTGPTCYARIQRLANEDWLIKTKMVRQGTTGPEARIFSL